MATAKVAMRGFLISKVRENSFPLSIFELIVQKKHVFSDLGTSENPAIFGSPEGLAGGRSYFLEQIFFHCQSTKMNLQGIR